MQTSDPHISPRFLSGNTEMIRLIRNHDWAATPLGNIDEWPISLRTTVGLLVSSGFPMLLFWGEDLTCIYNDAFRPSLGISGRHPESLGKPGKEVWSEIWDVIYPWMETVLTTGKAVYKEDMPVPFLRNGKMENIYWTFSYSPAFDDDGNINGIVVNCVETTTQIEKQKLNTELLKEVEHNSTRFKNLIQQAPVAIAVFTGNDLICESANDSYLPLVVQSREQFVGKPLFESLPETKSILEPIIKNVIDKKEAYRAEAFPIILNRNGVPESCFFDLIYEPLIEADGSCDGFMVVAHEVTAQVLARRTAEINRLHLQAVVNSAPFPIGVYTGEDLIIELANQTMLDTWGKGNDVVGKSYMAILPELKTSGIFEQLHGVLRTGIPFHANNQRVDLVMHGEMQIFYFKYSFTPLFDSDGNVYGVMNTAANVTDLVMAQAEARESNNKKDEFLSIASHELKTPLTNIKLYEQLLMRELTDQTQKKYLQKTQIQIKKLERLIGDLLDVTKISAGHLNYQTERTDVREIIQNAAESIRNEYQGTPITVNMPDPVFVQADKIRLEQVMYNLISNGVKYSAENKEITISLREEKDHAMIDVKDNGVGISKEDAMKIFDRFYRVGETGRSNVSGLGLGLFITNEIVKAHGGEIKLQSEQMKGSTFTVVLPLDN